MPTAPLPRARTYGPTAPVKLKHAGPPPAEVDAPGSRDAVTASARRSEALLASQHSASAVAPTQPAMRDPALPRSDRSPTPPGPGRRASSRHPSGSRCPSRCR